MTRNPCPNVDPRVELPDLTPPAAQILRSCKGLSTVELNNVMAHLKQQLRVSGLEASCGVELKSGDIVEIVSGAPKFHGRRGRVIRAARQRCYVAVEGHATEVYLFKSDCKVLQSGHISDQQEQATGLSYNRSVCCHLFAVQSAYGSYYIHSRNCQGSSFRLRDSAHG